MSLVNVDISTIQYEEKLKGNSVAKKQFETLKRVVKTIGITTEKDEKGIENKKVEIIVCGPARVGKSSLIKALTGQDVETSSSLNSYTTIATPYKFANDNVIIWDTKGFEKWSRTSIDEFWKSYFQSTTFLPSLCIFCVGTGAHADTSLVKYMFEKYVFKYNIPLCWVITKAGVTDISQTQAYIDEGLKLLGKAIEVIQPTIAWKTEKGFIIRINSKKSSLFIPNHPTIFIKKFGIETLKNILAKNISIISQQHLMELYKENESYLSYLASVLFEKVHSFGIQVTQYLEEDNRKMFEETTGNVTSSNIRKLTSEAFLNNSEEILSKIEQLFPGYLEKIERDEKSFIGETTNNAALNESSEGFYKKAPESFESICNNASSYTENSVPCCLEDNTKNTADKQASNGN